MKKRQKNFKSRLYSMFIGNILILITIVVSVFIIYSNRMFAEREAQNISDILNSVSQNLEQQFKEIRGVENPFYIYNEVFKEAEILNNKDLYNSYSEYERNTIEDEYTMILTKVIHTSEQDIRSIVFFPASQGDTAYYLGKKGAELKKVEYENYHEESWYTEAIGNQDRTVFYGIHQPHYTENPNFSEIYSYIRAIQSVDSKKIIGVVKIDISMDRLNQALNVVGKDNESRVVLLKDGKSFVEDSQIERLDNNRIKMNGHIYHMQNVQVPNTDLELMYLASRVTMYQGYFYIVLFAVLILVAGGSIAVVNYRRQAKQLVGDLEKITDGLQQVEKGKLDSHIKLEEDSEFKNIAEAINQMMDNLKRYIEKEYLMEIQQQKAEYRALQSQINPHFLYNTLNGFVALNRMGEKRTLERSIVGLSRLFRYSCSRQESVTIEEEVKFLEDYLKLEKLKLEERLEYCIWIDSESKRKEIPKMLLQPVVENSIIHGCGDTDAAIMIRILAITEEVQGIGKVTVLNIKDNGVGFDSKALKRGERVGIENVCMRVELFGKETSFQCISHIGEGTEIIIAFLNEGEDRK